MSLHGKPHRYVRHSSDAERWFGNGCTAEELQLLMKPFADYEQPPALPLKGGNRATKRLPLVLDPTGPLRRSWDAVTGITGMAIALIIPLWIAYYQSVAACIVGWPDAVFVGFDPGQLAPPIPSSFLYIVNACDMLFWVDIVLNFMTAIPVGQDRALVFDLRAIWIRYLAGRFALDVAATLPLQCIFLAAGSTVNWYNFGFANRMLRLFTMPTRLRHAAFLYPPAWLTFRLQRLLRQTSALFTVVLVFASAMWWVVRVQDFPGLDGAAFTNAPSAVTWPVFWQLPGAAVAAQMLWSVLNSISAMIGNTLPPAPPVTFAEMWVWLLFEVILAMQWIFVGGCVVAVLFSPNKPQTAYLRLVDEVKEVLEAMAVPQDLQTRVMAAVNQQHHGSYIPDERRLLEEIPHELLATIALEAYGPCVRTFPLFAQPPQLQEAIAIRLRRRSLMLGDVLIQAGHPLLHMFFVREGLISLTLPLSTAAAMCPGAAAGGHSNGHVELQVPGDVVFGGHGVPRPEESEAAAHEVSVVGAGGWFCEAALLGPPPETAILPRYGFSPCPCTATALMDSEVLVLAADDVEQLLPAFPDLQRALHDATARYWQAVRAVPALAMLVGG